MKEISVLRIFRWYVAVILVYFLLFSINYIRGVYGLTSWDDNFDACDVSSKYTIYGGVTCANGSWDGSKYIRANTGVLDMISLNQGTGNNHWSLMFNQGGSVGNALYFYFETNASGVSGGPYWYTGGAGGTHTYGVNFVYTDVPINTSQWYRVDITDMGNSIRVKLFFINGTLYNDQTGAKTYPGAGTTGAWSVIQGANTFVKWDNFVAGVGGGEVSGTVYNSTDGSRVSGATVCVGNYDFNCDWGYATTDGNGFYNITNSPYNLVIKSGAVLSGAKSGYFSKAFGHTFTSTGNDFAMNPDHDVIGFWAKNYSLGSLSYDTVYVANPDTSKYYFSAYYGLSNGTYIYQNSNGGWIYGNNVLDGTKVTYSLLYNNPQISSQVLPVIGNYTLSVTMCNTAYGGGCTDVAKVYTNVIYTMPNPNGTPVPSTVPWPTSPPGSVPGTTPSATGIPTPSGAGDYVAGNGSGFTNASQGVNTVINNFTEYNYTNNTNAGRSLYKPFIDAFPPKLTAYISFIISLIVMRYFIKERESK